MTDVAQTLTLRTAPATTRRDITAEAVLLPFLAAALFAAAMVVLTALRAAFAF